MFVFYVNHVHLTINDLINGNSSLYTGMGFCKISKETNCCHCCPVCNCIGFPLVTKLLVIKCRFLKH